MTYPVYVLSAYLSVNFCIALLLDWRTRVASGERPGRGETAVFCMVMLLAGLPLVLLVSGFRGVGAGLRRLRQESPARLEGD